MIGQRRPEGSGKRAAGLCSRNAICARTPIACTPRSSVPAVSVGSNPIHDVSLLESAFFIVCAGLCGRKAGETKLWLRLEWSAEAWKFV